MSLKLSLSLSLSLPCRRGRVFAPGTGSVCSVRRIRLCCSALSSVCAPDDIMEEPSQPASRQCVTDTLKRGVTLISIDDDDFALVFVCLRFARV